MFDWDFDKIIEDLKNLPIGLTKKKNEIEVRCCEYAEPVIPLTSNGYLRCTKKKCKDCGSDKICPCNGLYGQFDGFCTENVRFMNKKFTIPESGDYYVSSEFNMSDSGITLRFKENVLKIFVHCDSFNFPFKDMTFEEMALNDNSISDREVAETAVGACEIGLAKLGELERDLEEKLKAVKRLEDRLAEGMVEGHVRMTKKEMEPMPSCIEKDGKMYTVLYPDTKKDELVDEEVEADD